MNITFKFEKEFDLLMNKLQKKYGEEIFTLTGLNGQMDLNNYQKNFFSNNGNHDISVDQNSNTRQKNIHSLLMEYPKSLFRLQSIYLIWEELRAKFDIKVADDFVENQISGAIYTNDLHHAAFMPYCYAYSLKPIVENGLQFIDSVKSNPAKHLESFIQHVLQFSMYAGNNTSGAVGLPDLFVWLNYFIKKDNVSKDKVIQQFQSLTYILNQPVRSGQSVFTNFTYMDRNYINAFFENEKYPDGKLITDDIEDIIQLQKDYIVWFEKERTHQMLTFPVETASLLREDGKFVDEEFAKFIVEHNMKWQSINIYSSEDVDTLSSCCRLKNNVSEMNKGLFVLGKQEPQQLKGMSNSIGGTDLNIGSFKVVTINLPRIALESGGNEEKFKEILNERIDLVQKTLFVIRGLIEKRINQGVLNLYDSKINLMSLDRQFGTIGITGVFESSDLLNFTTRGVDGINYTEKGYDFVGKILSIINRKNKEGLKKYNFSFNVEQIPGEQTVVKLAKMDKILFGIKQPFEMYSNQWIPLIADTDMLNRIHASSKFDKEVGGGAILHINIDKPFKDFEEAWKMTNMVADAGVVYYAFNTAISACSHNHAFYGDICPVCGEKKTDTFMRVVGFLTPVQKGWNETRRNYEFNKRQFYK
jgi:ribonucleoside-triphosphate reductase